MRRRTDQRLFGAAGDEVGPGKTQLTLTLIPASITPLALRRRYPPCSQRLSPDSGDPPGPIVDPTRGSPAPSPL